MNLIYYYHVPKCAGTFISKNLINIADKCVGAGNLDDELESLLSKNTDIKNTNKSIIFNFNKLPVPCLKNSDVREACKKQIAIFFKNIKNCNYETIYVHHHMGYPGISDLLTELNQAKQFIESTGGTFFLFTCLRETISFITSKVNYQANDRGNTSSYKSQINNISQWNPQSNYLLYNHNFLWRGKRPPATKEDLEITLSIMTKIYTTKNISQIPKDISNILGKETNWDNTKKNISNKTLLPTQDEIDILLERNYIDNWLLKNYTQSPTVKK